MDWNELTRVNNNNGMALTAMLVVIVCYTGQFMAIPAYIELEDSNPRRFAQTSCAMYLILTIIFFSIGICGMLLCAG